MLAVCLLLVASTVPAQDDAGQIGGPGELRAVREGWSALVHAPTLTRELGLVATAARGVLTIRGENGILTLFQDSPDVLWQERGSPQAQEESLSGAARFQDGDWWVPVDALALLGLRVRDDIVEGPHGRSFRLVFPAPTPEAGRDGEIVDLGNGIPGLRMYAAGTDGAATQSLLLADAGLLGLAMPDQQEFFDDLVTRSGRDRALLVLVTATSPGAWETRLVFRQASLEVEVRYPFRLRLLEGNASSVGPDSPATAVVLLPESFNLREPIEVSWGAANATVVFRR